MQKVTIWPKVTVRHAPSAIARRRASPGKLETTPLAAGRGRVG